MHWAMSKVSSHTILKQHMYTLYSRDILSVLFTQRVSRHLLDDSVAGPDPKNPHQFPCPDPDPDLNE